MSRFSPYWLWLALSLPGLGDLPGDQGPSSGGLDLTGLWPSD